MSEESCVENKSVEKKETRKENREIILYAFIGLVLSIGSFFLFNYFGSVIAVTLFACIVDIVYSYFHVRIFFRSKNWCGIKSLFIPVLMIAYWALVFSAVCVFNAAVLKGAFSYTFFLYPIFLMPSFVLEVLIVGLICSGM